MISQGIKVFGFYGRFLNTISLYYGGGVNFKLYYHLVLLSISDLLPRINPVGFLTLPGHSGRASLRGISAPVVHISFCVRAVIATAFCQDANITTAITCVLSLGKNLTYHAARFLVCTRDKYYTAI